MKDHDYFSAVIINYMVYWMLFSRSVFKLLADPMHDKNKTFFIIIIFTHSLTIIFHNSKVDLTYKTLNCSEYMFSKEYIICTRL